MQNLLSKEEMETIINGDHGNVFAVLGIHKNKGSKEVYIRTDQPHTSAIEVLSKKGDSLGMMTKLDDRGFYQIDLGKTENFDYKFRITSRSSTCCWWRHDEYRNDCCFDCNFLHK